MRALTTGEIADYCGVNLRTVIRWIEKNHLKAYKLPGRGNNRVRLVDFLNFVDRHGMPLPQALHCYGNRVLVVDDDAPMASSIARTLGAAGFETRTALDGFQAGDALRAFLPAAMTLDLRLPGLDGFQVLNYVRGEPDLARLKILVISALPQDRLREAVAAGADDALAKPFEACELASRLKALLPEPLMSGPRNAGGEKVLDVQP
ncbi:response regulator [Thiocystis violacea]|uniref:response regulator n=1 Tax=Thiocystis violacea TaxID=13725 RepID=UPI001905ECEE|nr:response regulator [Thiocystis violacea]MBK1720196.1 response regulator [Thiocystis violacea]